METRKIQSTASGSFFITLPKDWVTDLDIRKGNEINILREEDGSLRIQLSGNHQARLLEFNIDIEEYEEENSLERCINSYYIQGSDIIQISSQKTITLENKKIIRNATNNLIGTEISEEFASKIIIRILVDPHKFPLHSLIKRIYTLVSSMHVDAIKSLEERDKILANDVINREKLVEKLFYLMLRQLNLSLNNKINIIDICPSEMKIDCVLGLVLARDLSKKAHYASEIAVNAIELLEKDISPEIIEQIIRLSRFVRRMQQDAILAFFKTDFMRANSVLNNIKEVKILNNDIENQILKSMNDVTTIVSLINITRNLKSIAKSAVAVSQDLQAKHRPHKIIEKETFDEVTIEPFDLISSLGYEKQEKPAKRK
ncbi:MAG: phosphate uptake regulator PhoU [Candidatus Lokiarchaeota archaeon]|nr:phosphate uptake regulator PhoU [Candidatus Lokiarchaeota archaeon]